MHICDWQQIQLHLFTACLFHHDKHSWVCLFYPCSSSRPEIWIAPIKDYSLERIPRFIWGSATTSKHRPVKHVHIADSHPPKSRFMVTHLVPLHMLCLTGRIFWPPHGITLFLGARGQVVWWLNMWPGLGMPFMCWFSSWDSSVGACCLVVERRGNCDNVPPARRVDLLIKSRVCLSGGSQECSAACSSELITIWWEMGQWSLIFSVYVLNNRLRQSLTVWLLP